MTTTPSILTDLPAQARPAAAVKTGARLAYLDVLRALLISLVIALHAAIAYGAEGDWIFMDPAESEIAGLLLTLVTASVQAFSLGLYFFLSGYFTPRSYDKKGPAAFWKDRLIRLGIPLLAYTFILNRIPIYFAARAAGAVTVSFPQFFAQTFLTNVDEGPTWFLFALLLFLAGYTLWRLATRSLKLDWLSRVPVPGRLRILAFGLLIAVLMFILGLGWRVGDTEDVFGIFSLMVIFFGQYIPAFIIGLIAARNDWLARFPAKDLRFWFWMSVGLLLSMPVMMMLGGDVENFLGGLYWQSAVFMLWVGLFSVSISLTLILWLRDRKRPVSKLALFAGDNNYAVYLLHPLVLVPLTVAFVPVPIHPLLKYIIVLPLTLVLCFALAGLVRAIPGMKKIL